jgi:hypothetical protein
MLIKLRKGKEPKGQNGRKWALYLKSQDIVIECSMEVPNLGHTLLPVVLPFI